MNVKNDNVPKPNLSIHREAREHEVDVPALRADVADAIHVELHIRRLWGMKAGEEGMGHKTREQV